MLSDIPSPLKNTLKTLSLILSIATTSVLLPQPFAVAQNQQAEPKADFERKDSYDIITSRPNDLNKIIWQKYNRKLFLVLHTNFHEIEQGINGNTETQFIKGKVNGEQITATITRDSSGNITSITLSGNGRFLISNFEKTDGRIYDVYKKSTQQSIFTQRNFEINLTGSALKVFLGEWGDNGRIKVMPTEAKK